MVVALLVALICALLAIVVLVLALVPRAPVLMEPSMPVTFEPAVASAEGRSTRSGAVTKVVLSVAGSTFEVQGQLSGDLSVLDLLTRWLASLPAAEDQARIAALAAQLRQQSDSLSASVHAQQGITQHKE